MERHERSAIEEDDRGRRGREHLEEQEPEEGNERRTGSPLGRRNERTYGSKPRSRRERAWQPGDR
jgi:hypothetical protein